MDKVTLENVSSYDKTVEEYMKNTFKLEEPEVLIRKEFMQLLKKGDKILDVACGPGRDAKFFSEKGFKVVGIDLSAKSIEKAMEIAPLASFQLMDIRDIDKKIEFTDSGFNGIWFNAGLLSVEKKFALPILTSLFRILKDKGVLLVSVKEGIGEGFQMDKRYNVQKYYSLYCEEELKDLLSKAGFKYVKTIRPELKSSYHTAKWINVICEK